MRVVLGALAVVALAIAAASALAAPAGTVTTDSVRVSGLERTYRVFVPNRLPEKAPVVFVFHGGLVNGAGVARQTRFDEEASRRGFIAVYPDGIGRTWNAGTCCGLSNRLGVDDVAFVSSLLDKLTRRYSVDRRRVFATGISNGGLFSYFLECRLSGRIAAVAPVSATLDSECSPSQPVSILHVHGLADENIPFDGGPGTRGSLDVDWPPVQAGVDRWRSLNSCPTTGTSKGHHTVTTSTWSPCRAGTAVTLVTIAGAKHKWPREQYDATREVWRFRRPPETISLLAGDQYRCSRRQTRTTTYAHTPSTTTKANAPIPAGNPRPTARPISTTARMIAA